MSFISNGFLRHIAVFLHAVAILSSLRTVACERNAPVGGDDVGRAKDAPHVSVPSTAVGSRHLASTLTDTEEASLSAAAATSSEGILAATSSEGILDVSSSEPTSPSGPRSRSFFYDGGSSTIRRKLTNLDSSSYINVLQIAKVVAEDGAKGDYFGYSLAIDGDTLVVGAYGDDDGGSNSNSGSAYIFTRDVAGRLSAGWTQRAKLVVGDGAFGDNFGMSVAIDGDTLVVGAVGDSNARGSVYIFTRNIAGSLTAGWTQSAKFWAQDSAMYDLFGWNVAIDGDTVVVGATGDDDKGSRSGSAYIFTRNIAGSLTAGWTQRAKVVAEDGAAYDSFGRSVAIDGDTVVVGATGDDDKGSRSGSAYIFTCNIAGRLTAGWTQRAKMVAEDGAASDAFGTSVAIDGDTVVVGAYSEMGYTSGSGYIFSSLPPPPPPPAPKPCPAECFPGGEFMSTYGANVRCE
jgi:hypothetical protein